MARDLRCGLCHVTVNGDIVSVVDVMSFEPDKSLPAPAVMTTFAVHFRF